MSAATLTNVVRIARDLLQLPRVTIDLGCQADAREVFRSFTKPHPRFKLFQSKRWGVALLRLPTTLQVYTEGKKALRTNQRKAGRCGYTWEPIQALDHLHEILAINASGETRQGLSMSADYMECSRLAKYFADKHNVIGVFDANHLLVAYACVITVGELAILARFLGHAQHLQHGIMYLLCIAVADLAISQRNHAGPKWLMYDTWYGASSGLRYFKQRTGFAPYVVRWI